MDNRLKIKPFNDFWLNCELNNMLSMLCSVNSSYRKCAYLNSYKYYLYEPKELCKGIDVYRKDLYEFIDKYVEIIPYDFVNQETIIEEIIEKIYEGTPIGIAVDLYHWLPNTIIYQKKHWYHYSMIVGVDQTNNEFIILDEDNQGYREHHITRDKILKAFLPNTMDSQAIIFKMKCNKILDYNIDNQKVIHYSEKIIESIDSIPDVIWDNELGREKEQAIKMMIASTSRIYNCQISNKFLLKELFDKEKKVYSDLYEILEFNEKSWRNIHNYLMKKDMLCGKVDYDKINKMSRECLNYEKKFWHNLLLEI